MLRPSAPLTAGAVHPCNEIFKDLSGRVPVFSFCLPLSSLLSGDVPDEWLATQIEARTVPPAVDQGIYFRPPKGRPKLISLLEHLVDFDSLAEREYGGCPPPVSEVPNPEELRARVPLVALGDEADDWVHEAHFWRAIECFSERGASWKFPRGYCRVEVGAPRLDRPAPPANGPVTLETVRSFFSRFPAAGEEMARELGFVLGGRSNQRMDAGKANLLAVEYLGTPVDLRAGSLISAADVGRAMLISYGVIEPSLAIQSYVRTGLPRIRGVAAGWGGGELAGAAWSCDLQPALWGAECFAEWMARRCQIGVCA